MFPKKSIQYLLIAGMAIVCAGIAYYKSVDRKLTVYRMLHLYGESLSDSCEAPIITDSAGIKTVHYRCYVDPVYDPIVDSAAFRLLTVSRCVVIRELILKRKPILDRGAFEYVSNGKVKEYVYDLREFDTTLNTIPAASSYFFASMNANCETKYTPGINTAQITMVINFPIFYNEVDSGLGEKKFNRKSNARAMFINHAILQDSALYFERLNLFNGFLGNHQPILTTYPLDAPAFVQYEF